MKRFLLPLLFALAASLAAADVSVQREGGLASDPNRFDVTTPVNFPAGKPLSVEGVSPTAFEVSSWDDADASEGRDTLGATAGVFPRAMVAASAVSDVTGLQGALDAKAPIASPMFTGTVTLPSSVVGDALNFVSTGDATLQSGGILTLKYVEEFATNQVQLQPAAILIQAEVGVVTVSAPDAITVTQGTNVMAVTTDDGFKITAPSKEFSVESGFVTLDAGDGPLILESTDFGDTAEVRLEGGTVSVKTNTVTQLSLDTAGAAGGNATVNTFTGVENKIITTNEDGFIDATLIPTSEVSVQYRRGTDAERQTVVFANGEPVRTTDTNKVWVGDGVTLGGIPHVPPSYSFNPTTGAVGIAAETTGGVTIDIPDGEFLVNATGATGGGFRIFGDGAEIQQNVTNDMLLFAGGTMTLNGDGILVTGNTLDIESAGVLIGAGTLEASATTITLYAGTEGSGDGTEMIFNDAVNIIAAGNLQLDSGRTGAGSVIINSGVPTTEAKGLWLGGDTALYRSAANVISTTDAFTVSNATASTTAGTGAVVVTGGIGVGGEINATGAITSSSTLSGTRLNALSSGVGVSVISATNQYVDNNGNANIGFTTGASGDFSGEQGNLFLQPRSGLTRGVYIGTTTTAAPTVVSTLATFRDGLVTVSGKIQATTTSTLAGINMGGVTADPSSATDGDFWYRSDNGAIRFRALGVNLSMANTATAQTLSLKTLSSPVLSGTVTGTYTLDGTSTINNPTVTGTIKLPGYTVSTLPSGTVGMNAYVTDALAPTYGAVAVGGGAVVTPVFYDGTNWTTR